LNDLVDDTGAVGIVLNAMKPMECSMGTDCEVRGERSEEKQAREVCNL